jgi:DNA-binding IclR family transcriptional regulator
MTALPKQPNQSVIDGIRCLQEVVARPDPVGVSDLAEELNMETTRAHRLLRTLAHMGLLRWTEKRKYAPGPALPVLAAQTLHASGFYKAIQPLIDLHKKVNMVTAMGVIWNRSVSYLFHADPDQPPEQAIGGFDIWPATLSGIGIALLAKQSEESVTELYGSRSIPGFKNLTALQRKLAQVRKAGYAYVETTEQHHHTLAIVLKNNPYMAVGISSRKMTERQIPELLEELNRCVNAIQQNTAGQRPG